MGSPRRHADITRSELRDMLRSKGGMKMRSHYLLLLSTMLLAGCDGLNSSSSTDPRAKPAAPVGRFMIVHSPHVRADTMLLDTVTGDTWVAVQGGNEKESSSVWEKMESIDPLSPTNSN
jgi:hypothetical protein